MVGNGAAFVVDFELVVLGVDFVDDFVDLVVDFVVFVVVFSVVFDDAFAVVFVVVLVVVDDFFVVLFVVVVDSLVVLEDNLVVVGALRCKHTLSIQFSEALTLKSTTNQSNKYARLRMPVELG